MHFSRLHSPSHSPSHFVTLYPSFSFPHSLSLAFATKFVQQIINFITFPTRTTAICLPIRERRNEYPVIAVDGLVLLLPIVMAMCYRLRTTRPCAVCAGHKLNVFQLANIVCATCPNNENRSEHRKPKDTVSLSFFVSFSCFPAHTHNTLSCVSKP